MLVLCTNFIWFWVTRHPRWFAGCPPLNGWYWTNKNMVNNSFWNVGHSWLPTSCAWKVGKDFPPCKRNSNKPLNDGSRWWQLKDFLGLFTPIFLGRWSNLTIAYFSNGLVQPPRSGGWKTTLSFPSWEWDFLREYFCGDVTSSYHHSSFLGRPKANHLESQRRTSIPNLVVKLATLIAMKNGRCVLIVVSTFNTYIWDRELH